MINKPIKRFISMIAAVAFSAAVAQAQEIISVGSLMNPDGTYQVSIELNGDVDASGWSYELSGGSVADTERYSNAGDHVPDNVTHAVILTANGLTTGDTYTLTINGTSAGSEQFDFKASDMTYAEVGDHQAASIVTAIGSAGFDIQSSGRAQWAAYDETTLVYKAVEGDWDFSARVIDQDFSSQWARAGLMFREDLDLGSTRESPATTSDDPAGQSQNMTSHANPASDNTAASTPANPEIEEGGGNYTFESNARVDTGGATVGAGGGIPNYPNGYVRLARSGSTVTAWYSNDGGTWTELAARDFGGLDNELLVGPSFSPETVNISDAFASTLFLAQIREFAQLASVSSDPVNGSTFADPANGITLTLTTSAGIVEGSISVSINGADATGDFDVSGGGESVTLNYTGTLESNESYTVELSFTDGNGAQQTKVINFATFSEGNFTIEAEDFNFAGGQYYQDPILCNPLGGMDNCYFDKASLEGIDSHETLGTSDDADVAIENLYRYGPDVNRDEAVETNFSNDIVRDKFANAAPNPNEISDYDVDTLNAGDWLNYTRTFDEAQYFIYLRAQSSVSQTVSLSMVSNPTSENQTASPVGTFVVPNTGGSYALVPLTGAGGGAALPVSLSGEETLRLTANAAAVNMRWNYIMFLEADASQLPTTTITDFTPGDGAVGINANTAITATIQDGTGTVVQNSVSLTVNGTEVNATVNQSGGNTTVSYTQPGGFDYLQDVDVSLSYMDSEGNSGGLDWSFTTQFDPDYFPNNQNTIETTSGTRWIELEDFNADIDGNGVGGEWVPNANGGPNGDSYTGGEYAGLAAVHGVDYNEQSNTADGNAYRQQALLDAGQNLVQFEAFTGGENAVRTGFTATGNYKIGWTSPGDWYNYTRDFPSEPTTYDVYMHLSSGGTDPLTYLEIVNGDPTQPNPATTRVGRFSAPASGDWATALFYQMTDVNVPDCIAQVTLSGTQTLRVVGGDGNYDWDALAFVPADPREPCSVGPIVGANMDISIDGDQATLTWDTSGTLQGADNVDGPYSDVAGASSPHTVTADSARKFYRVQE